MTRPLLVLAVALCIAGCAIAVSDSGAAPRPFPKPAHAMTLDPSRRMDLNRLNMWETNFGSYAWDLGTGNAGLVFPRGSHKTTVFAAGFWIGAQVSGGTRLAVAEYSMEYVPGPMRNGSFVPDSSQFRVYKVHAFTGDPQDTAHVDRNATELAADSQLDPIAHHGWGEYMAGAAPYGAPVRTWRLPKPGFPGDSVDVVGPDVHGDLMTWCVFNDADPAQHVNDAGRTLPLGIEVQRTTWAFDRQDALGNTIYMQWKIIDKGGNALNNAYVSLWADPDVGGATDDVSGCDRNLNLGFTYNGVPNDIVYGSAPPAVGIMLLRGPRGGAGTALGMTAFTRYVNGTDPHSWMESYNYMRGLNADGSPMVNPVTGQVTTFVADGDPLTGTGWLDLDPADRRVAVSSGPFQMMPGDTQTVEAAIVVSQGADRLTSVGQLKCEANLARGAWAGAIPADPCRQARSCPMPAEVWSNVCAGNSPLLTADQITQVAGCMSQRETTFTWAAGQERAGFCAVVNLPEGADLRAQAKREFAALTANVCAGALDIRTAGGDSIMLNPLIGVSCPGVPGQTIAEILRRAVLHSGLRSAFYLDNVPAHPPAIAGVDAGGRAFGGGALPTSDFFGSSLDPASAPDSFVTVELRFDATHPQKAYRYLRLEQASTGGSPPQGRSYVYGGFREVPLSAWDVVHNVQLEMGFAERALTDDAGTLLPGYLQPATFDSTWAPDASSLGGREYLTVFRRPYSGTPQPLFMQDGAFTGLTVLLPGLYSLWARRTDPSAVFDDGDAFRFDWAQLPSPGLDSMFVVLESMPLSDPAVQQSYQDVISCLQAINAGIGIGASCDASTPTMISLVSAEADPDRVRLTWQAQADGAHVERSQPGGAWAVIGVPDARDGSLVFEDRSVLPGARYGYRLVITRGGEVTAGGEAWVNVPLASVLAIRGLTPNPAPGSPVVSFSLPVRATASLELLDVAGRRVAFREVGSLGPGHHVVTLDRTRIPAGIYLIRLTQRGRSVSTKGVLMK